MIRRCLRPCHVLAESGSRGERVLNGSTVSTLPTESAESQKRHNAEQQHCIQTGTQRPASLARLPDSSPRTSTPRGCCCVTCSDCGISVVRYSRTAVRHTGTPAPHRNEQKNCCVRQNPAGAAQRRRTGRASARAISEFQGTEGPATDRSSLFRTVLVRIERIPRKLRIDARRQCNLH